MTSELKIKVCGMRDPVNIHELILCEPDYMGFIFYPRSKRYMQDPDPEMFRKIPPGIRKVGVFVNEGTDIVKRMWDDLGLDLVQLHGNESPQMCRELNDSGIAVMKAFGISGTINNEVLRDYEDSCELFLFDTRDSGFGGTGEQFNWEILDNYTLSTPFFLSGGIGPEDAMTILNLDYPAIAGIDINSRFEIEPGVKDVSKVSVFIQSIRRVKQ